MQKQRKREKQEEDQFCEVCDELLDLRDSSSSLERIWLLSPFFPPSQNSSALCISSGSRKGSNSLTGRKENVPGNDLGWKLVFLLMQAGTHISVCSDELWRS